MLQFVPWTSLQEEGFGASLQHYTELIEKDAAGAWNVPDNWKLIAQMPFGKPAEQPSEKQFNIILEHIKVYS